MWRWALLLLVVALVYLLAYGLCVAAGRADETVERLLRERKDS